MSSRGIPLGARGVQLHGKVAAGRIALVDAADYELIGPYRWTVHEGQRPGRTHGPYAVAKFTDAAGARRAVYMHKLLTGWLRTDHEDHDGLNNQRSNLRPATRSQNLGNQRIRSGGSSPFKGVSGFGRRWTAEIKVNGDRRALGTFRSQEDAALAYDAAALAAWREFAYPNFPVTITNQRPQIPAA